MFNKAMTIIIAMFVLNVNLLNSKEFIQDFFKVNDVFLLPSMNTSNSETIKFNYFGDKLYVIDNEFSFKNDSISFILYESLSSNNFKTYDLIIPKLNFSKNMHITDIYIFNNKLYLLEFSSLIEFVFIEDYLVYNKSYSLKNSCSEILNIDSTEASLTLNYITSDVNEDKAINFIYKIELENNIHYRVNFDNSDNYKMINIGPRKNKVIINDSVSIYSDIINFSFNIESNMGIKKQIFIKENWNSNLKSLGEINVDFKHQKNTFIDLYNYHTRNSTITNLFKIGELIIVQYRLNTESDKSIYYDILKLNYSELSLSIIFENLKDLDVNNLNSFGVSHLEFSNNLIARGKYLLDLSKFPFEKEKFFKDKDQYLSSLKENIITNGIQYSVIIREIK